MKGLSLRLLIALFVVLTVIRVGSLGVYPLADTTEARYGEIARLMVTTNDWITPQNDPGVPFWAKPPLSFWTQALSMKIFGINEFAARFAATELGFLTLGLLWWLARRAEPGRPASEAWLAVVACLSMPLMYSAAGAVMTDMSLTLATTLAMVSFWFMWTTGSRPWGYAFFGALGLAMLAKGPIGLVLVFLSLCLFWAIEPGRFTKIFHAAPKVPWVGGVILMIAVFVPWYAAAEIKTPGFIDYFIVGEHIKRFLLPYWKGDMYGNAHIEPLGMIWVYYALSILTWLPVVVWIAIARLRKDSQLAPWTSFDRYLLAWALATPMFFTIARNIIWPYVLPSLPALALLVARECTGRLRIKPTSRVRWAVPASIIVSTVLYAVIFFYVMPSQSSDRSLRDMLAVMQKVEPDASRYRLIATRPIPHSAKFYAHGKAERMEADEAMELLRQPGEIFLLLEDRDLTPEIEAVTEPVSSNHKYVLRRKR